MQAVLKSFQDMEYVDNNQQGKSEAGDILGIFHGPAAAVTDAPVNGDEVAPLLRLVRIFSLVPQGH